MKKKDITKLREAIKEVKNKHERIEEYEEELYSLRDECREAERKLPLTAGEVLKESSILYGTEWDVSSLPRDDIDDVVLTLRMRKKVNKPLRDFVKEFEPIAVSMGGPNTPCVIIFYSILDSIVQMTGSKKEIAKVFDEFNIVVDNDKDARNRIKELEKEIAFLKSTVKDKLK